MPAGVIFFEYQKTWTLSILQTHLFVILANRMFVSLTDTPIRAILPLKLAQTRRIPTCRRPRYDTDADERGHNLLRGMTFRAEAEDMTVTREVRSSPMVARWA